TRVGIPAPGELEGTCTPAVLAAFTRAVDDLADHGWDVVEQDLEAYLEAGSLLYGGAFVAERYAAVGSFVTSHPCDIDPSVRQIIEAAGDLPAHALAADQARLARLRRTGDALWNEVDAVVLPSAPFHPTLAEVAADPLGVNAALGRFTNGCNLLGWCAA